MPKTFLREFSIGVVGEIVRQQGINLGGSGRQEVDAWERLPDDAKRPVVAILQERVKLRRGIELVHSVAQADGMDAGGDSGASNRRRARRQAVVKFLADHFDEIADVAMRAIGR